MPRKKMIISEKTKYLAFTTLELVEIEIRTNEIIASSAIEGEELDRVAVENSIMKEILFRDQSEND